MEDYDNLYDDSSLKLAAADETANESTDLYGDIVGSSALNDSRDQGLWNGLNESAPAAVRAPSQDPAEHKAMQQYPQYPQQQAFSQAQYHAQPSQPPAQQQTQRRPVHFEPPALDTRPTRVQSVVNFEGLDWWVTDRDLLSACERFGRVKHVKIALEKENGKSKGWALVEFMTPEEASECVKSMNGVAFPHESCVVSAKIVDSSRLQLVLTEFHPFQVNNSRNDHRNTGRSGGPPPYQQRRRDQPHPNISHGHMNPNMMNNQMGPMMMPMMMGPMSGMNQMGGFMAPGMGMMNGGQMMPMMNMPGGQMMMPRGNVMPNMMPAGPPQGGQPMHPMGHQSTEPPRDSGRRRTRSRSRSRSPRSSHKERDVKDSKDKEKSRERDKERSRSKERRRESGSRRDDRDRRDRR